MGREEAPSSWETVKLVFFWKPDAKPQKGINSYRAVGLTSVMSKWYATCVILRLEKEKVPEELKQSHVRRIDGISCQHVQVMAAETLGMARRLEERRLARKCQEAHDVYRQHGQ